MIDLSADRFILKNVHVLSPDGNSAVQASVGVSRGRITAVGDLDGVRAATGRSAAEIDLEGAMALPGFWESHIHLVDGALFLAQIDLRGCEDPQAVAVRLREPIGASKAGEPEAGEWVIGHGWADLAFPPGVVPNRRLLDELVPSHPAVLTSRDGHSVWLNTAALKLLKVASWRLPPQEMPLDDSGQPVGMLYENGVNRVNQAVRRSLSTEYRVRALERLGRELTSAGITSVNDIATADPSDALLLRRLQRKGKFSVRIYAGPYGPSAASRRGFMLLKPLQAPDFRVGPTKYLLDGAFGSSNALLTEPYEDSPGKKGYANHSRDELTTAIRRSLAQKEQLAIHAIGDGAIKMLLDAYDAVAGPGRFVPFRHRVEHLQIIREEDIERLARHGLIASMQPVFLYERDLTLSRVGRRRIGSTYRFRSFAASGAPLILNSDWPYGGGGYPPRPDGRPFIGFEPLLGIHAVSSSLNANSGETLSVSRAIRGFTATPAFANWREGDLGSLEPGKRADIAVLSRNILACPVDELLKTEVLLTILEGRIVHQNVG